MATEIEVIDGEEARSAHPDEVKMSKQLQMFNESALNSKNTQPVQQSYAKTSQETPVGDDAIARRPEDDGGGGAGGGALRLRPLALPSACLSTFEYVRLAGTLADGAQRDDRECGDD